MLTNYLHVYLHKITYKYGTVTLQMFSFTNLETKDYETFYYTAVTKSSLLFCSKKIISLIVSYTLVCATVRYIRNSHYRLVDPRR